MNILNFKNLFHTRFKKYNFSTIFILVTWFILWASINSMPGEIKYMLNGKISFFNGLKNILAISFSIFSIFFLFHMFIKRKIKKFSLILVLFFLYLNIQLIGLATTSTRDFTLDFYYLVLYGISAVSLLILIDNKKTYNILKYILLGSLIFLFVGYSVNLISLPIDVKFILEGSLYGLIHPDVPIFNQAPPRITGLTRALGIISILLIIILLSKKDNFFISLSILILIFLISIFIWMGQSRGSLLCYYLTSAFIIFILNNRNIYFKILLFAIITFFSIISSNLITNSYIYFNGSSKVESQLTEDQLTEDQLTEDQLTDLLKFNKSTRVIETGHGTSGRFTLWKESLFSYDKAKLFGYGPQADRYILKDNVNKYGNNVSNALIYSFLSSGYFGALVFMAIYLYFGYIFIKFIYKYRLYKKQFILKKNNIIEVLCVGISIFLLIRSIFENSFSVFSIDFLLLIQTLFMLEKIVLKKIKIY